MTTRDIRRMRAFHPSRTKRRKRLSLCDSCHRKTVILGPVDMISTLVRYFVDSSLWLLYNKTFLYENIFLLYWTLILAYVDVIFYLFERYTNCIFKVHNQIKYTVNKKIIKKQTKHTNDRSTLFTRYFNEKKVRLYVPFIIIYKLKIKSKDFY